MSSKEYFVLTGSRMLKLKVTGVFTAVVLLAAGDPSWKSKASPKWTEDEARQILADSPWAKTTKAGIARLQSEDQRREGGNMGQPRGIGYDGIEAGKTPVPVPKNALDLFKVDSTVRPEQSVTLLLRWESALPIRIAELKSHVLEPPTLEGDGYRLAVYGIPGKSYNGDPQSLGNPLKQQAFLKREGKKDVKPSSVEVFQLGDGLVVTYLFPLSAEISRKDGRIEFEARIGRIGIIQFFNLEEMQFEGRLEL
jgi:hypothetical protein